MNTYSIVKYEAIFVVLVSGFNNLFSSFLVDIS
jgi:hypothetical protein